MRRVFWVGVGVAITVVVVVRGKRILARYAPASLVDQATEERIDNLEDPYRLFRCYTIMYCVDVCPKGLNASLAIGKIKSIMVKRAI